MLFKSLVVIGLTCSSTFFGFKYCERFRIREKYFHETILMCDYLIHDISYAHASLGQIVSRCLRNLSSPISKQLSAFLQMMEDGMEMNEDSLRAMISREILTQDEFDYFLQFLNSLGKSAASTQIETVNSFKIGFAAKLDECKQKKKQHGGLGTKLGFLAGLCLSILFV